MLDGSNNGPWEGVTHVFCDKGQGPHGSHYTCVLEIDSADADPGDMPDAVPVKVKDVVSIGRATVISALDRRPGKRVPRDTLHLHFEDSPGVCSVKRDTSFAGKVLWLECKAVDQ